MGELKLMAQTIIFTTYPNLCQRGQKYIHGEMAKKSPILEEIREAYLRNQVYFFGISRYPYYKCNFSL